MTQDDVIRLAREAGHLLPMYRTHIADLQRFADLVAAAEREACAQVCERLGPVLAERYGSGAECISTADECAAEIRAR